MDEFDVRYKTKSLGSTEIIESARFIETKPALIREYDPREFWIRCPEKSTFNS
jgi:hypothetical protein